MHLTLHLTTQCNMRCTYCYSPPRVGVPMSVETVRGTLDFGARITEGSCGIVFFGGEPLLCKDLIHEAIDYAQYLERRGLGRFHFKVTTNGLLLDEDFLRLSVRHGIFIAMSVDGVGEAHDAHRRFPDGSPTFDHVRPRLEMLLAARPYSSVIAVVNPDTARHLAESVQCLLDLSCRYLIVSLNYAAPWCDSDLAELNRQLTLLGRRYVKWTMEGRKFYLSPFEVKISSHVNGRCYVKERCELAARQLSVDPQGYLYPCVQFAKAGPDSDWCIGSVHRGIDEARREHVRRQSEADHASCRSCAIRERCNNTCGCLNWQTTGSVRQVSPVLCRYEQMLMPIADAVARKLYKRRNPIFLHKHYNAAYPVLSLLEDALPEDAPHAARKHYRV